MFENIGSFFRRMVKPEQKELGSKDAAKERLHLVLMQDRANVSSEFLELMKQEILDVIKKYIIVDESQIDVRLTNQQNVPIVNIKNEMLVGKVKEFDGKTNSINFGEYKMVIETVSNADGEETGENETEIVENVVELTEEQKQEVVEDIKEEIKEKIEEVKEALEEEQKEKENSVEEKNEELQEENIEEEVVEDKEEPVIIFNDETSAEEEDEEDDDDVTFDDLLKAAEEEDRLLAEKAEKSGEKEIDNVKVKHNNRNQSGKSKNNKRKGKK